MNNFVYDIPVKVYFGENQLGNLAPELLKFGKRVLLTYGGGSIKRSGLYDRVMAELKAADCTVFELSGIEPNPRIDSVRKGAKMCKDHNIDVLLAVGGGSTIDATKFMAAGACVEHDAWEFFGANAKPIERALPIVTILTLSATGSEMDAGGVITNLETQDKLGRMAAPMLPKVSFLDPTLTYTVSPYQTACGGYDIFAHVMEAYINGDPHKDLTLHDRMQEGVMKAALESLEKVWNDPRDTQARGVMMWAASIALNGWLLSGTFGFTPMHQMGHVLSARYNATHGATLACMMVSWMKYFETRPDNAKYVQLANNVFGCGLKEAYERLDRMMSEKGVQTRISAFGATEADLDELTDAVVSVSFGPDGKLNGHPKMTRDDIYQCFKLAL